MRLTTIICAFRVSVLLATIVAATDAPALSLTGVVSRKVHAGVAGNADRIIDRTVAIDGAITVESRAIDSGHSVVFQFDETVTSVSAASVVDAAGSPAGSAIASPSGNAVIVTLGGVADARRVTVRLIGVNGAFNTEASMGFLLGDTNNSYDVNGADISGIRARAGQTVSIAANNAGYDLNGSGRISAADIVAVKMRNGRSLPATGFTVGGSVTGLGAGKTVVLRINGGNDLNVSAIGAFTFAAALQGGASYTVTVLTQPAGQTCSVTNGSGNIAGANVINVSVVCAAASGSLDTTFGNGGFVVHGNAAGGNGADVGQSMAIDASGRIVVSGYSTDSTGNSNIALWRYNANGTLDTTFNGTGVLTETGISWNGAATNQGIGVAIDSQGRIVVVSYTLTDNTSGVWTTVVWRYNPDGTRDTTFNGVGLANFPFGQMQSIGYGLAIDSADRIVVGGIAWNGTSWDQAVSRNIVSGELDTTFNGVGYATHGGAAGGNGEDVAQGIAIDGNGRILLTGGSVNANGASDMTVWRYNADGTLDTSFNGTGTFTYVHPNGGTSERNSVGSTISFDSSGRIVIVGRYVPVANSLDGDLAIWRLNANGTPDTTFNGTGLVTHNGGAGGNGHDDGYAGLIDSTGRIYATGVSLNALGNYDTVVWRFNADGTLDTGFNGTGIAVFAGAAGGTNATDTGRAIKIDSSGRIVVTGSSRNAAGNSDMVIWRINP